MARIRDSLIANWLLQYYLIYFFLLHNSAPTKRKQKRISNSVQLDEVKKIVLVML